MIHTNIISEKFISELYMDALLNALGISTEKGNLLSSLYEIPKKDKGLNVPHFEQVDSGIYQQADILYLPDDSGYKYALVVVDVGSRKVDAEPLKNKDSKNVAEAFKKIYKRKILEIPSRLQVDPGTEFKNEVKKWFENQGSSLRVGEPGRHRNQAVVENANKIIGSILHKRMAAEELQTGEVSREWVSDLPKLVQAMNRRKRKPRKFIDHPVCEGDSCNLLSEGMKVRIMLESPQDVATGKKLHGKFRSSDIRWNPKIQEIESVMLQPSQPPLYKIKGLKPYYTKNQLQAVKKDEAKPGTSALRKFIVDKIVDKKKIRGQIHYKVTWKGYPVDDATWEPRKTLMKDVPDIVELFEKG